MKPIVDVAVVQFAPRPLEVPENVDRMADIVREEAARAPTDLIVFPELATTGYVPPSFSGPFSERLTEASDTVPGKVTDVLAAAARDAGTYVAVGLSERGDGRIFNSMALISPDGEIAGVHRKAHLFQEEFAYFSSGDRFDVIETDLGTVGLSICYDSRYPEESQSQAQAGAEILICNFAYAGDAGVSADILTHRAIVRAWENNVFYVLCNRVGVQDGFSYVGGSVVTGPLGQILSGPADDRPTVLRARLTSQALRAALDSTAVANGRRAGVGRARSATDASVGA